MSDEMLPPPAPTGAAPDDTAADDTSPDDTAVHASALETRNVITELVGTALVMLLGPGLVVLSGGRVDDLAAAFGFGIGTALAIGVIGAVANPAFTLALLLVREVTPREAVGDWVGQVLGGIVGGAVIWGINDQTRAAPGANGWGRGENSELGSVISAELVFGILVVVVLLGAIGQGLSQAGIAAFTGLAVAAAHLVLIPIDGGGLNPARSIGSAVFSDTDPSALGQLWVFVIVPLVAAAAAVFVWLAIDDAEIDDTIFDETMLDDAQNALTGDRD